MKTLFKTFTLLAAFLLVRCSDEQIDPAPLSEDMSTSAHAYVSGTFSIGITTNEVVEESSGKSFTFFLQGAPGGPYGDIAINWGDGTIEKHRLGDSQLQLFHQYQNVKNYTIQVTGNLMAIAKVDVEYQTGVDFRDFNLSGLKNLKAFRYIFNSTKSPASFNFSHNRTIEEIRILEAKQTTDIIVPPTHNLGTLEISGSTALSTAVIDRLIARIYDSVKARPRTGYFFYLKNGLDENYTDPIAQPSTWSMNKLRVLRDTYDWHISPNP